MKKIDFTVFQGLNSGPGGKVQDVPYLDLFKEEEPGSFLFTFNGKGMIAEDNIHIIKGREKTGKSAVGIAFMAAAIGGEFLGIKANKTETPILWVDTEQDTKTLRERALAMLRLAGYEAGSPQTLSIVTLRATPIGDRLPIISQAIRERSPKMVFIDGAVDLCEDFNDSSKSANVVSELLKLLENYHCTIITVIHTNKFDEEARGHLGGILQQKSAEVYLLKKTMDIATVSQELSRFTPVPPFSFQFEEGFSISPVTDSQKDSGLRDLFLELFENDFGKEIRAGKLNEAISEKCHCSGRTANTMIVTAVNALILDKREISKREVYYSLNRNADRDFADIGPEDEDNDVL